jgi:hypothetical protein
MRTLKPRNQWRNLVEEYREKHPELLHVWTLNEVSVQAGLRGLPTSPQVVANHIRRGVGPKVIGTAGSALLVDPQDARRWISLVLSQRDATKITKPSGPQIRKGLTADSFASI